MVAIVPAHPISAPELEDILAGVVVQVPPDKIGSPESPAVAVAVAVAGAVAAEQAMQGGWPHTDHEPGCIDAAAGVAVDAVAAAQAAAVGVGMPEPHIVLSVHGMLGVEQYIVASAESEGQV